MKRDGFTLPELLAVMAALSVVMGISVILLLQAFEFQRANEQYSDGIRAVDRFIADFRNDVHTYGKPEILTDGTALLRWNTGTETIAYLIEPGTFPDQQTIIRTIRKEGEQTDPSFGETYRLPERTMLWFVEGKETNAGLIALSLWGTPTGTEPPNPNDLNPFDRTLPKSHEQQVNPKYASNWRTIIARYSEKVKE